MAGSKSFSGNQPKTGRQRSAEQITARQDDLLGFINSIFVFADSASNYGKVLGFNASTGEIDVFKSATFTGTPVAGDVPVSDGAGNFDLEPGVIGSDKAYTIGPDGLSGQYLTTDAAGNLTFTNPPAETSFTNVTGNFTAVPNARYNIDASAQITIDSADVVAGFVFTIRPKYGVNFSDTPPVLLYNSVNPYENTTENLTLDIQGEYVVFSQNGTNLQIAVKGISQNV